MNIRHTAFRTALAACVALLVFPIAHAGTPLICHPYEIGDARTLPADARKGVDSRYDRANLTADTLALLTPNAPLLVRMETLRRAALYSTAGLRHWKNEDYTNGDRTIARDLFERLRERTQTATGDALALALFDAGFFVETLRHAQLDLGVDGFALLTKSAELRPDDAEIEFALALASSWPKRRDSHEEHLRLARMRAKTGTLLAANLRSHFGN
jgi:hypothetical protein